MFFSPFSSAITSLGEERANLSAFRTFVRFVLVWICRFPLPLGVWEDFFLVPFFRHHWKDLHHICGFFGGTFIYSFIVSLLTVFFISITSSNQNLALPGLFSYFF